MSTNTTKKRGIKPAVPPKSGRTAKPKESAVDTEPMTTFLPFCAHCEKQIVVPNTTILYCSERCRKKDNQKMPPLNASTSCPTLTNWTTTPPPLTPSYTGGGYFDLPIKNYVVPSSPTSPHAVPFGSPDLPGSISIGPTTNGLYSTPSGLSSPTESLPSSPPSNLANLYMPARRPSNHVRTLTGSGTIPQTATNSTFYNAYQRPLPPRTYSSSPRSIELVTPIPQTPPPTSDPSNVTATTATATTTDGPTTTFDLLYENSYVIPESSLTRNGTLKTMFNFDKIQGKVSGSSKNAGFAKVSSVTMESVDGVLRNNSIHSNNNNNRGPATTRWREYGHGLTSTAATTASHVRMPNVISMMHMRN